MPSQYQTEEVEAYIDGDALQFVDASGAWISARYPVELKN